MSKRPLFEKGNQVAVGHGRPPHQPTDITKRLVGEMRTAGLTHEQIARVVGIDHVTLTKFYREELDTALPKAIHGMAQNLYQRGMSGDTSAAMFWLKTRAGWRDRAVVEHTGPDGQPIAIRAVDGPPEETYDDWCKRKQRELADRSASIVRLVSSAGTTNGGNGGNLV